VAEVMIQDQVVAVVVGDIGPSQTRRRSLHTSATCQQALYRATSNKYSAVYRWIVPCIVTKI